MPLFQGGTLHGMQGAVPNHPQNYPRWLHPVLTSTWEAFDPERVPSRHTFRVEVYVRRQGECGRYYYDYEGDRR
jgi:hypothetical protein